MGEAAVPVTMILCLLLYMLPGPVLSQTPEPQSREEFQRQKIQQIQQESQQHREEWRRRMIQQNEEFWRRVEEQEKQHQQQSLQGLGEEQRQRREEFQQRNAEQRRQMMLRQREFWLQEGEREKERQQRVEEQRRQSEEHNKAIRKAADEYVDEVWQEALGATPEQWQAIKLRLERIRQLRNVPYVDVSIYWIAGSTSYRAESLVGSPEGTHSTARAYGWFSVTTGAGSVSESSAQSDANREDHRAAGTQSSSFHFLKSGQSSATTRTATASDDANQPGTSVTARHTGSGRGRAVAGGSIEFGMHLPGPIKKQVGDIALGWQWDRPSFEKLPNELTEGDKVWEQLADVLDGENLDAEQLRQQVEALRLVRQQRRNELREAQRQLCEVVTPEQEAKLILMGYLD